MMDFIITRIKYFIFIALTLLFSCIYQDSTFTKVVGEPRDLAQILTNGKIVVVTDFTSINYFIYKGEPMGYQYEMLSSLAEELGIKLELIAENDPEKSLEMLRRGEVDLIATNLSGVNSKNYLATTPYLKTHQLLIQRKNFSPKGEVINNLVRDKLALANKKVYVNSKSNASDVLSRIVNEDRIPIIIQEDTNDEEESLIDLVSSGKIDYAVCDESVAKLEATVYSNIDIETSIGDTQELSWTVSKKSPDLLNKVNQWITSFAKTSTYSNIYDKYYNNPYMVIIKKSDYFYSSNGKLSIFDSQIKSESANLNWDWRLLASLIYQESKFNPTVKSESGAYGLMQFMPITSKYFGIDRNASPNVQLKMGVRYLKMLEKYMVDIRIPEKERLKFVLAAYNAGFGHILDARNLARKYGKDPNIWDNNVGFFIQNKTDFYNDTVVRYGYLRGSETYKYVSEILDRYDHYKNIIKP
jgi:membrane-bound lytic murein transglycosylase F